jgi:hypothetical protein
MSPRCDRYSGRLGGIAGHSGGIAGHSGGIAGHSGGIAGHSDGIGGRPSGVGAQLGGVGIEPSGIDGCLGGYTSRSGRIYARFVGRAVLSGQSFRRLSVRHLLRAWRLTPSR